MITLGQTIRIVKIVSIFLLPQVEYFIRLVKMRIFWHLYNYSSDTCIKLRRYENNFEVYVAMESRGKRLCSGELERKFDSALFLYSLIYGSVAK